MARFEIVATSVTFEQEDLISPINLSFRTIQRVPIEKGAYLSNRLSKSPMALWRDYLIGSYSRAQPGTGGLLLWSITENSISYFEGFVPRCSKVFDDVLFVSFDDCTHFGIAYRCIHMPSLVISTRLSGGSLSLTENAFAVLLPKCVMICGSAGSLFSSTTTIYSIHAFPPTRPRYCFIIKRLLGHYEGVEWEVLEVEIDLSIPGPIKIFNKVSSSTLCSTQPI